MTVNVTLVSASHTIPGFILVSTLRTFCTLGAAAMTEQSALSGIAPYVEGASRPSGISTATTACVGTGARVVVHAMLKVDFLIATTAKRLRVG